MTDGGYSPDGNLLTFIYSKGSGTNLDAITGISYNITPESSMLLENNSREAQQIIPPDSAYDPTIYKIKSECKSCKRPIRTLLLVGKEENTVIYCKCGKAETYE